MPVLEVKPTPADLILSGDDSRMDALTTEVSDMAYDLREAVDAILPTGVRPIACSRAEPRSPASPVSRRARAPTRAEHERNKVMYIAKDELAAAEVARQVARIGEKNAAVMSAIAAAIGPEAAGNQTSVEQKRMNVRVALAQLFTTVLEEIDMELDAFLAGNSDEEPAK